MPRKNLRELTKKLLERLNPEDPNWINEAQDKSDERDCEVTEVLKEAGYTEEHEDWDDLVDELGGSVIWLPGHYAPAQRVNAAALRRKR